MVARSFEGSLISVYGTPAYSNANRTYSPRPGVPGHYFYSVGIPEYQVRITHVVQHVFVSLLFLVDGLFDDVGHIASKK